MCNFVVVPASIAFNHSVYYSCSCRRSRHPRFSFLFLSPSVVFLFLLSASPSDSSAAGSGFLCLLLPPRPKPTPVAHADYVSHRENVKRAALGASAGPGGAAVSWFESRCSWFTALTLSQQREESAVVLTSHHALL